MTITCELPMKFVPVNVTTDAGLCAARADGVIPVREGAGFWVGVDGDPPSLPPPPPPLHAAMSNTSNHINTLAANFIPFMAFPNWHVWTD